MVNYLLSLVVHGMISLKIENHMDWILNRRRVLTQAYRRPKKSEMTWRQMKTNTQKKPN